MAYNINNPIKFTNEATPLPPHLVKKKPQNCGYISVADIFEKKRDKKKKKVPKVIVTEIKKPMWKAPIPLTKSEVDRIAEHDMKVLYDNVPWCRFKSAKSFDIEHTYECDKDGNPIWPSDKKENKKTEDVIEITTPKKPEAVEVIDLITPENVVASPPTPPSPLIIPPPALKRQVGQVYCAGEIEFSHAREKAVGRIARSKDLTKLYEEENEEYEIRAPFQSPPLRKRSASIVDHTEFLRNEDASITLGDGTVVNARELFEFMDRIDEEEDITPKPPDE